ncbi:MAG: GIY-YIG nuclease family protein, partial [Chloroflexi bacterium]|nr:GIY-YIG nuclease family protein [Chloroflexota bacterium]
MAPGDGGRGPFPAHPGAGDPVTEDLTRRLNQHNRGHERSTKAKRPYVVLLAEAFETREAARDREKYYK